MSEILNILKEIKKQFEPFDSLDLLSKLSALRLLPHNGDHSIRIYAVLHAASSIPVHTGNKTKSKKLSRIINSRIIKDSHLKMAEDPSTQGFCEEITFFNGGYRIFPGAYTSIVFCLKHILKSLFLRKDSILGSERHNELLGNAFFILSISEEIAKRAQIKRNTDTIYRADLFVPPDLEIERLARAVIFSEEELMKIASTHNLNLSDLGWLISEAGKVDFTSYDFEKGELLDKPILKLQSNFIISDPSSLLASLRRRVLKRLLEEEKLHEFSRAYKEAVWDSSVQYLDRLGVKRLHYLPHRVHKDIPVIDGVFQFDRDKALIVVLINDDLENLNKDHVEIDCETFKDQIFDLSEMLYYGKNSPNEIMYLWVISFFERAFSVKLVDSPFESTVLSLTADSLEIISMLEGGKNLFLYKYTIAQEKIRQTTKIISFDNLSEYEYFRNKNYSYYFGDDVIPTMLTLSDDMARAARLDALKKFDLHTVINPLKNSSVEVMCLHDKDFPLYIPSYIPHTIEILLGGLELPIWFFNLDKQLTGERRILTIEIVDMLGYWFYQLKNYLNPIFQLLISKIDCLQFHVSIEKAPTDMKLTKNNSVVDKEIVETNFIHPNILELKFAAEFNSYMYGETNEGERIILSQILDDLRVVLEHFNLATSNLDDAMIQNSIDTYMPKGKKKKLSVFDSSMVPEINPKNIPGVRLEDDYNINSILDEIGEHVKNQRLNIGKSKKEQAEFVNKNIVSYLWGVLQRELSRTNGDELIEYLIAQNEAITRERTLSEIQLPMRLEIADKQKIMNEFNQTYRKIVETGLACRFLIECTIGFSPSGLRPISEALYDQLISIAGEIISWGFTSDLLINNIGDMQINLLPSGRIGRARESYEKAMKRFTSQVIQKQLVNITNKFSRYWEKAKTADNDLKEDPFFNEINLAFKKEFGFTIIEFREFQSILFEIAINKDRTIIRIPLDEIINILNEKIGKESVVANIENQSLCKRENFFSFPNHTNIKPHEFYPWRFNRLFSYVRRPLLKFENQGHVEILYGIRHLKVSLDNFFSLLVNGRLAHHAKTQEFKRIISKLAGPSGRNFNKRVANIFRQYSRFKVFENITKFGKVNIEFKKGQPLGDIDVLVVDTKTNKFLLLECKDLLMARTPYELNLEMKKVFDNEDSQIEKHIKRTNWVKQNLSIVIKLYGLNPSKKWKVKSLLIVDEPLFSSNFKSKEGIEVVTYEDLKNRYSF